MSPFTNEVLSSLEFLRHAIADVSAIDRSCGATLTAIVDDLVVNMENQMLLVFANVGVMKREDEERLVQQRNDRSLLDHYREACGTNASVSATTDGKLDVKNAREPKPSVEPLPPGVDPLQGDALVQRSLLTSLHLLLESLAINVHAERTMLYVAQKGTGTLRVVTSVPDVSPAHRGAFVASHQGIVGSVYSTGIGLRADKPSADTRRTYIDPVDAHMGVTTVNTLAFPVLDKATRQPVAVIECANKAGGAPWADTDEQLLQKACQLAWYMLCYHKVDFHNGMVFNPAPLHALKPFRAAGDDELVDYHGAADVEHTQLVVRLRSDARAAAEVPLAVKGRGQHPDAAVVAGTVGSVKELQAYLTKMEEAHRHLMNEVVQLKDIEATLREDVGKKTHKIRLLEDNAQCLHEQLMEARAGLNNASFAPVADQNARDFGPGSSLGSFLRTTSPTEGAPRPAHSGGDARSTAAFPLPPLRGSNSNVTAGGGMQPTGDVIATAAAALELLKRSTLENMSPAVRARMFMTPQPGGASVQRGIGHAQTAKRASPAPKKVGLRTTVEAKRRAAGTPQP